MKKGYWMAMLDVTDPDEYPRYIAANAEAFARHGAKFLTRGGRFESPEGPTGTPAARVQRGPAGVEVTRRARPGTRNGGYSPVRARSATERVRPGAGKLATSR